MISMLKNKCNSIEDELGFVPQQIVKKKERPPIMEVSPEHLLRNSENTSDINSCQDSHIITLIEKAAAEQNFSLEPEHDNNTEK